MTTIRKMDLVVGLYIFGVITAEVFAGKTFQVTNFSWMHLNASVAIFVIPLLFTMVDAVVEVFGRERARSMVYTGLITIALLMLYSTLATRLTPSYRFVNSEPAFDKIFSTTARISAASLTAFAVSELLDVVIFSKLRQKLKGKALWLRNNVTNFISQFADSAIFLSLAFYSLNRGFSSNISFLWSLLLPYWLLRCTLSIAETPIVYVVVNWLRGSSNPNVKVKEA